MKNNIYSIKGTKDILPHDSIKWRFIENKVHKIMKNWGFGQIRTPVFEKTQLFKRSVGEETDIVSKQMYSFKDQSDNDLTLRPELTAPVMRAYIQHNMERHYGSLNKLYYIDSLYRQERPQAGRLREFSQFGAEAIGSENPEQDLEIIFLVLNIFKDLGLDNLNILINSVGSIKSRENYKKDLIKFFQPHKKKLSEISKKRLEANPLRILDSKIPEEIEILKNAPDIFDYLSKNDKEHFDYILSTMKSCNIKFSRDPKLVRGLDYYSRTTFEIVSSDVGAQSAICGGGRYDSLVEKLGGKPTPAVGFAAGIDRILIALSKKEISQKTSERSIQIICFEDIFNYKILNKILELRKSGIIVYFDTLRRSIKAQMREANKNKVSHVIIIGSHEMENNKAQIKNLNSSMQVEIDFDEINNYFQK